MSTKLLHSLPTFWVVIAEQAQVTITLTMAVLHSSVPVSHDSVNQPTQYPGTEAAEWNLDIISFMIFKFLCFSYCDMSKCLQWKWFVNDLMCTVAHFRTQANLLSFSHTSSVAPGQWRFFFFNTMAPLCDQSWWIKSLYLSQYVSHLASLPQFYSWFQMWDSEPPLTMKFYDAAKYFSLDSLISFPLVVEVWDVFSVYNKKHTYCCV